MINQARGIYRPDIILVGMIAVGITGAILGYLIELLQKLVMKRGWRQ